MNFDYDYRKTTEEFYDQAPEDFRYLDDSFFLARGYFEFYVEVNCLKAIKEKMFIASNLSVETKTNNKKRKI